jgi:hypothetical protein
MEQEGDTGGEKYFRAEFFLGNRARPKVIVLPRDAESVKTERRIWRKARGRCAGERGDAGKL